MKTHKGFQYYCSVNILGYRIGYIIIPEGHPWYGKDRDDLQHINVHGKITYSKINENNQWKIGFDCGHADDLPDPSIEINKDYKRLKSLFRLIDNIIEENYVEPTFKDENYVEEQCKFLCEQAVLAMQKDN